MRKKSKGFKDNYSIRAMFKLFCHIPISVIALADFIRTFTGSAFRIQLALNITSKRDILQLLLWAINN